MKLLHPEATPVARQLFEREGDVLSRLTHPHVVRLLDRGKYGAGESYLVQELIRGRSFREMLRWRLTLDDLLYQLGPIMEALAAVHEQGLVHCDVKPENVVLHESGGGRIVPKLVDFGLARESDSTCDIAASRIVGTPHYMSPEQMRGDRVDPRSDVWSLGVCVYEALTGRSPFTGQTAREIFGEIHSSRPPPPSGEVETLAPAVDDAILRALAPDPDARWQRVVDFHGALERARGPRRASAPSVETLPAPPLSERSILHVGLVPTARGIRTDELTACLTAATGRAVRLRRYFSYIELVGGLREGEVELARMSPAAYAEARRLGVARLLCTLERGAPTHASALLGRGVATLEEIVGRRAVWVDRWSDAGYLVPRALLRSRGLDPAAFATQEFVGSYEAALAALREGRADVTASYCERDPAGTIVSAPWSDPELRVLAVSDPIPGDAFCVATGLDPLSTEALERALVGADWGPAIAATLDAARFTEADEELYEALGR